jgi:hypothetical protein
MKHLAILISICFSFGSYAQTIKENQVDEFTKNKIVRTSWEPLSKKGKIYSHARASIINTTRYLELKIMLSAGLTMEHSVFAIEDGETVMLKLDNDSIVNLNNPEHQISCTGCGAINIIGGGVQGIHLKINLANMQIDNLINHKITKIRIYTTDGFVENEVPGKFQETVSKELKLIQTM